MHFLSIFLASLHALFRVDHVGSLMSRTPTYNIGSIGRRGAFIGVRDGERL